jgi:glycopeptide antibiotics resistance protein
MSWFVQAVPLFVPALVVSLIIGIAFARRLARAIGTSPAVALLLVASVGLIFSATLTPLRGVLEDGAVSSGSCDLRRIGWAPLSTYLRPSGAALNVVLFIPLGLALGMLPRARRWTTVAIAAGVLSPILVEGVQLLVPALGRGCEAADIVDNTTGILIGLVAGRLLGGLVGVAPDDGTGPA